MFPAITSIQWGTEVEPGGSRRVGISHCSRWAIKKHLNYEHWRMKKILTIRAGWQLVLIKSCSGQGESWPGHRYSDIAGELGRLTVGRATKLWVEQKQEADTDGPRVTSVSVSVLCFGWLNKATANGIDLKGLYESMEDGRKVPKSQVKVKNNVTGDVYELRLLYKNRREDSL